MVFRWLRQVKRRVAPDLSGSTLDLRAYYELSAPEDHALFIQSLGSLLPADAVLYLEGVSIDPDVVRLLEDWSCAERLKIARGTLWPKPQVFHVPMGPEVTQQLAALFEHHASPEICDHFHAYHLKRVLLQWHDAFFDDPLLLAGTFAEAQVRDFCGTVDCSFEMKTSDDSAGGHS